VPEAPLQLLEIEAFDDGLAAVVFVSTPAHLRTSAVPGLSDAALSALPGLERHPCSSGHKRGIVSELADTETPHLAEHVALELLALAGVSRGELRGRTTWDFARDGAGMFRVELYGASARACERALREAVGVVGSFLTGEPVDVPEKVSGVRLAGGLGTG